METADDDTVANRRGDVGVNTGLRQQYGDTLDVTHLVQQLVAVVGQQFGQRRMVGELLPPGRHGLVQLIRLGAMALDQQGQLHPAAGVARRRRLQIGQCRVGQQRQRAQDLDLRAQAFVVVALQRIDLLQGVGRLERIAHLPVGIGQRGVVTQLQSAWNTLPVCIQELDGLCRPL